MRIDGATKVRPEAVDRGGPPPSDEPSGPAAVASRRSKIPGRIASALTVVALLPVITTVVTRAGRAWLPVQDFAVIDLRIRDVWSADIPMVGAYSRYGWNHPGPWLTWATAPFSLLFGRPAWATLVGFALLQGVAIIWLARLCWIKGGLGLITFGLAVVGLWYATTGSWVMLEPWNPHVAVPFFILFVFQIWFLSTGDLRRLPGAAVTATLLVQTHIGYLPLVGAALVFAAGAVRQEQKNHRLATDGWRRTAGAAGLLTAILWLPPAIEEIRRFPRGSMARTIDYFALGGNQQPAVGIRTGAGLVAATFRVPAWLGGPPSIDAVTGNASTASLVWWLVPILLLVAGIAAIRRTGHRADGRLLGLATVLLVAGAIAISRISEDTAPYLFYWREPVAVLFAGAALRPIARAAGFLNRRLARTAIMCGLALAAVIPALGLSRAVGSAERATEPMETDATVILGAIPTPTTPTIIRFAGSPLKGLQSAVIDELDRRGAPVRVDTGGGYQWGYSRALPVASAGEIWYTTEDGQYSSLLTNLPGARVLTATTPLTPAEEAEMTELDRTVTAQLIAAGRPDLMPALSSDLVAFVTSGVSGVDPATVNRMAELNQKVIDSHHCRCAVIAFSPANAPPITKNPLDPPQL